MGNIFNDTLLVGKIKSNYSIIEKIDEDFFGEVYKCTKIKSNDLFAIKVIKKNFFGSLYRDQCFKNIRKEIEDSQKMKNKYSLKYIDSFETADFFNIVSEYYNTTLEQYLIDRKFGLSIKEIKSLFNKLNLAFREIAVKSIIHGEINLSNIKIKYENDDIIPLISDYGQKTLLDGKLKVVNSGLNFYAPELLSGENFNYKVDLWSIGAILYSLYYNEYPYKGNTQVEVFVEIQKNKLKKSNKNEEFNDLISKLLVIDPESRINWNEYFNHNFWKLNDEEDENIFYEEEKLGNNDSTTEEADQKNKSNLFTKKCIIYYGINGDNKNKMKMKKLEIPYKEIISNKNFLVNALTKKKSLENLYKLVLIDCNLSNIEILSKTQFENLTELNLSNNGISNIEPLTQICFKNLISLYLSNNIISNLEPLSKAPFTNLENLLLNYNEISNIFAFSKVRFKNLNKLNLSSNDISDVSILKNCPPLENLTYLSLSDNKIEDVEIYLSSLVHLDLSYNQINNIIFLASEKCRNIEYLNLGKNNISNIFIFKNVLFSNLKILYLNENNIKNINVFSEVPFTDLKELILSHNEIEDIEVLCYGPFINLKKLDLVGNKIFNIGGLTKLPFDESIELNIKNNEIKFGNSINGKIINFLKEKYKYFKY